MLRLLTRPRWLLRHLAVVGLCVAFFFLSRWQFHRGQQSQGTVQNYGYSVEWLIFGVFVCFFWWKQLMDELHPEGRKGKKGTTPDGAAPARVNPWKKPVVLDEQPPPVAAATPAPAPAPALAVTTFEIDPEDEEVVRYNEYLAAYAANPRR